MFQDPTQIAIGLACAFTFIFVTFLFAKSKATKTAEHIGDVKCNRCGHEATAKVDAKFVVFKGVQTKLSCSRCGSEDWKAA